MQVKAQGLLNAAKWIETEYGRDALGSVVRACSEPVRDRYVSGIAINWHPVEEFIEFVATADRMLGSGNGYVAEEIGAAGARANMKGTLVRIAFYVAQPEFFFRRVAGMWRQFNDEGEMLVHNLDERSAKIEVSGIAKPNATFCSVLSGWARQVGSGLGIDNPTVRHPECRARNDARCIWEIRWRTFEKDDANASGSSRTAELQESINRLRAISAVPPPPSGSEPTSGRLSSGRVPSATRASSGPPASSRGKLPKRGT